MLDEVVLGTSGRAFLVKKGQSVKVISIEGGPAVGDFVAFNMYNLAEAFDQARTKANQHKIFVKAGDRLYSKANNVMFIIEEDTYGHHDLQYGMCSKWVIDNIPYSAEPARKYRPNKDLPAWGCWENLVIALKEWNISPLHIPSPLNIFQTTDINIETGEMKYSNQETKPGDYIKLKAEMDVLAAISSCPLRDRSLRVQVF